MRGKQAAKAANRRAQVAQAKTDEVKGRLSKEREDSDARIKELEAEVRRLKDNHRAEAERLAAEEIARIREEMKGVADQRAQLAEGLLDVMKSKEYLVFNACRFLSMVEGIPPFHAMARVATWVTEEDFGGVTDIEEYLTKLALPADGWVAALLRRNRNISRTLKRQTANGGTPFAISIDEAQKQNHDLIHEKYQPSWYEERPVGGVFRHRGATDGVVPVQALPSQ